MSDVQLPLDHAPQEPRRVAESQVVMSMQMNPADANPSGDVHGGTIMRLVDSAAGIAAIKHARRRVVTASMDDMSFVSPVYIGDVVTVRAMVNDAYRTSMEIGARVDVEGVLTAGVRHVASAHLVYVGLDENGRPAPVPPVLAETEDEKRRQAQARVRREQRLLRKRALQHAGENG